MSYRKKMIEVALPLEAINKASAREKSIRHGHPSTLHLWWARRPLAACRAVLFASLVDDPSSDPQYRFSEDAAATKRAQLFNLIEQLVKWENTNNETVLNRARAEIARCVASLKVENGELKDENRIDNKTAVRDIRLMMPNLRPEAVNLFLAEYAPPVLDPFCGGGSIPLEAQRLGLRAYASDLNPLAVLITKALIEIPPKFAGKPPVNPDTPKTTLHTTGWKGAEGLAEDVRYYGKWMRDEAEKRIGHLYPKVKVTAEMSKDRPDLKPYIGKELTVIAWLWARTVASPNPVCKGAHVPLVRSFWLSTKKGKEAWVEPVVDRKNNTYRFEVRMGKPKGDFDPGKGTKPAGRGSNFECLLTGATTDGKYIKSEGQANRMKSRMMAMVAEGNRERIYLSPTKEMELITNNAKPTWKPEFDLVGKSADQLPLYGMKQYWQLFTPRQLVALTTFSDLVLEARGKILKDSSKSEYLPKDDKPIDQDGLGPQAYADAVATYLGLLVNRLVMTGNNIVRWNSVGQKSQHAFGRQALPMVWDYSEPNFFAEATGSITAAVDLCANPLGLLGISVNIGISIQKDSKSKHKNNSFIICTDPPYYDNIGYADLSDLFYIWIRRSLFKTYPQLFSTLLTPKAEELIASPYRHQGNKEKAKDFFENGLVKSFTNMYEAHNSEYPLTVYYAFKQVEEDDDKSVGTIELSSISSTGWETMLISLINSGFSIHGTWPMRTEMKTRQVAMGTNALASSIVLVCRPKPSDAPLATRREFIASLKKELPVALSDLQWGNIAPVDLAQASIGPGMSVFTRYSKVMESDGSPMTVRTALALINQTLDEVLAEQEGEFDADTRWAVAWFEQHSMEPGIFGVAETLSKAKNTSVNGLVESGILEAGRGKVRLLKREELPEEWDPVMDKRPTVWEATQYLILALEQKGEQGAADLMKKLGGLAEMAHDLTYRLYNICDRKKWAQEALAYNSLIIAWPEIVRLAHKKETVSRKQEDLF